jgi:hypothetical protein
MKVHDPGHIYECEQLGGGTQMLTFVKRSSDAVTYKEEWPGMQTQEVLRALIDRTIFLNDILPCSETEEALKHLRCALYWYEVRAYRRKQQKVNRTDHPHTESSIETKDIPFTSEGIEHLKIGEDGHIIV